MNVASIGFAAFVLGIALLQYTFRSEAWRIALATVANVVFVYSFASSPAALIPLGGLLLCAYLAIEVARRHPSSRSQLLGLIVILVPYIYLKRFSFLDSLPALPLSYTTVGLSYVLFRVLHLLIDAGNGDLPERVRPVDFLNYCCNFLCFVSGPIQRYEDFLADRMRIGKDLDPATVLPALSRMVVGFFKVTVLSALGSYAFQIFSPSLLNSPAQLDPLVAEGHFVGAVVSYCAYLYYNFSGYTDIVIGAGVLLGQHLPENFDRPFRARSFLEFWSRWHMTLSNWFKFYLFNPLVGALVHLFPSRRAMPYIGVAAFFVTFMVMGLWHGTTGVFVIYGFLMGAGASVNKLWQIGMTRHFGIDGYRVVQSKSLYAGLSRGLTYAYFSIGISCLWMSAGQMKALLDVLGLQQLLYCTLLLTAGSALALATADEVVSLGQRLTRPLSSTLPSGEWTTRWALAAEILVVVGIASLFHKAPEFVYKAF